MKIEFTKMQAAGNDYIYIDCKKPPMSGYAAFIAENAAALAVQMSERRKCVGADGVVLILQSPTCDALMKIYNSDGSEGKMCGNAVRCIARYLYDEGYLRTNEALIDTVSGVRRVYVGEKGSVRADMGRADFEPRAIPVANRTGFILNEPFEISDRSIHLTCLSVGNPHAVAFDNEVSIDDIRRYGPFVENNAAFGERINFEIARISGDSEIEMRVWERGSGETNACGTGACAVCAAAVINGYILPDRIIKVKMRGGEAEVLCSRDFALSLSGMTRRVFEGVYEYDRA